MKKLFAGTLAAAMCLLSGCSGNIDNREDPLAGHSVDALLPFPTRQVETSTATPTPAPQSTSIVNLPQNWQNEAAPEGDTSTKAPATPAPTREPVTYARLEQGDQGEDVARLQRRLIELGYLTGSADGTFGANTKSAVRLFQKALGLSQTGVATVSLQEKLFMSAAPVYVPSVAATNPPSVGSTAQTGYQALVFGDTGAAVQALQQRLITLGYLRGTADGKFGANTEKAVKAFQAQQGLSQTGVASPTLQTALFAASAPYAPATQAPTPAPTKAPTQPPAQGGISYKQLEPGDMGEDVIRMQNRLKQLGYFTGNATGNYYQATTAAVKLFQAAAGLTQSGIATSETLTQLYAASAPVYTGSASSGGTVTGYTTLAGGSKGTEVFNLQKRLIELGYLTGTADGSYGNKTSSAVMRFQAALGYPQDGVASAQLQTLLFSDSAPVYVPTYTQAPAAPTQAPTQAPAPGYAQLNPGDTGEAVKRLQSRLKELGFFSGLIGGNYLTKTTDAVRLFQAAINHAQTGVATPEMQAILFSDSAPDYTSVESDYVTLEKQDSGIQVMYLQQRLIELGYLTGTADGDFGSRTESAVRAFQTQMGLPATGTATPDTQSYLFSHNAPYAPVPTQAPTSAPTQVPTQAPTQPPVQQPSQGSYPELKNGNSGEDVKTLQRRLQALGYFDGQIGGNYLTKTETAVKLFQAAVGYPQDGVATSDLQALLFSGSAPSYTGSAYIDLTKGMTGPAVRNLQQQLINLGYLTGTADGDFGGGTENAVKRFQAAVGYPQDGVASVTIQHLLFSADTPVYTPQATDAPVVTNPPAPTEEPVVDNGPRDLAYGDKGEAVKVLQQRLIELGYLSNGADGDYGNGTAQAIMRFQAAIGWAQDGVATIDLQSVLFSSDAPVYVAPQTGYPTLSYGDDGEDVKAIQRRLKELGYFDGDIGGNYLTKTEAAVKLFQAALGWAQDGVATHDLQTILFSPDAPAHSTSSQPDQLTVLAYGDSGSAVRSLQERLIYLGWLVGHADGDFGEATANALMAFQYRMGLVTDGVAGIEVQDLLYAETAPAYVEYFELLPGAEGEEVLAMQLRLIELGYLPMDEANTDGIYGTSLQGALALLQTNSGMLPADPEMELGIATIELQTFLFSENAVPFAILPEA